MPKKFKGENSKAAEARAKKDAVRQAEADKAAQEKEDALWQDDDKQIARKQQRKEDKEKKRQEQLDRKKTLQLLHEEEMESIKGAKSQVSRLTRAQISEQQDRIAAAEAAAKAKEKTHVEVPLEENVNRIVVDGDEARTVDEAISMLSVGADPMVDRHPEKRMKAAYNDFEESRLPDLKAENPNMRLSQLKQMLKKEWLKSPLNPLNQKHESYNAKT